MISATRRSTSSSSPAEAKSSSRPPDFDVPCVVLPGVVLNVLRHIPDPPESGCNPSSDTGASPPSRGASPIPPQLGIRSNLAFRRRNAKKMGLIQFRRRSNGKQTAGKLLHHGGHGPSSLESGTPTLLEFLYVDRKDGEKQV
eukprot:4058136-Prymnesium_polylepis.1